MQAFTHLKLPAGDLKKVRVILEEMSQNVKKWLSDMIIFTKYDYYSRQVQENKSEFIFSQNALVNAGLRKVPDYVVSYHKSLPNSREQYDDKIVDVEFDDDTKQRQQPAAAEDTIPEMFKGKLESLKTKWVKHKKSKWNNMAFVKCHYKENTLPEFIEWFARYIGLTNIQYSDIIDISSQRYFDIMNDKDVMFEILQDPSYYGQWMSEINRKIGTVQVFWDTVYAHMSDDTKIKHISNILNSGKLYPNDLHMVSISELLNVSILMIHRGKYGKFDTGQARGELDDLKVSSTLYAAKKNMGSRPLLIFHKNYEKTHTTYNLVVEKNKSQDASVLYLKYDDVPYNVKILADAHLKDQT